MKPLLKIRGLRKEWRSGVLRPRHTVALDGVDLEIQPGEVVGLMGESGSGKTTLARVALGLWSRSAGDVEVCGVDPEKSAVSHLGQLLFQDAGASLNPGLTVLQILQESAQLYGKKGVDEVLERMDLRHRTGSLPSQLSGGEKRRVTLGQIWLADPPLLLADEPTAGLDASRRGEMIDLLLARRSPERGFLLISHDLPLVLYACSRIVVMREGRMVDDFPTSALWASERHAWTGTLRAAAGLVAPC